MRYLIIPLLAATILLSSAPAHADLGDQLAKLLPNDGAEGDLFGHSVAISGETAIVGAIFDDDNGGLADGLWGYARHDVPGRAF